MLSDSSKYRVYYEDTDAGGVVYYGNYLKFAERARTDMLRKSGFDHQRLAKEKGVFYVVRKVEIQYLAPGRLDDMIEVISTVTKLGKTSVDMTQEFFNQNGTKLGSADVQIVCVKNEIDALGNAKVKSIAMPVEVMDFFKG